MSEVKAMVVQKGLIAASKEINVFVKTLFSIVPIGEGDANSILARLPFFVAVRLTAAELQRNADRLRSAYETLDEEIVFGDIHIPSIDPKRLISSRASRDMLLTRSMILLNMRRHMRDLKATQDHLMKEETPYTGVREV